MNRVECCGETELQLPIMNPSPVAPSDLVLQWLGKMRLGVLFFIAEIVTGFALGILIHVEPLLQRLVSTETYLQFFGPFLELLFSTGPCLQFVIGALGIWFLVSPEPGNARWLRTLRWILRPAAVVVAIALLRSLLWYLVKPPSQWPAPAQSYLAECAVSGLWLCLFLYLRMLAKRLDDGLLRRVFGVLSGLWGLVFVSELGWTLLVIAGHDTLMAWNRNHQTDPLAPYPVTSYGLLWEASIIGLLWNAFKIWIMCRLYRRLQPIRSSCSGNMNGVHPR